jgi:hypothetical protein
MSLVRFTEKGDFKPIRRWSLPEVYEVWLAELKTREYDKIIRQDHQGHECPDRPNGRGPRAVCGLQEQRRMA